MRSPSELITEELEPEASQRRFTGPEVQRMLAAGILGEDEPLELIGGVLIAAEPQSALHSGVLGELNQLFTRAIDPQRWRVLVQAPLAVDEYSEPEPDLAIVPLEEAKRRDSHPSRAVLVIEVAHSSFHFDTHAKRRLYAAAGVPEYWVIDVDRRRVLVWLDPARETGTYGRALEVDASGSITPTTFPDLTLKVAELFPERGGYGQ